jgi:glycosyltransferase involved in cell wall biosynthesis
MKSNRKLKVALVTESLWAMGGANRVLETIAEIYPDADIYALFGEKNNLSKTLQRHKIYFSTLNNRPFIKIFYRYTYHLWPKMIERFDLSPYDLVISSSSSVAQGVISPITCKHIAYIHSPQRYLWDLKPNSSATLGSLHFSTIKGALRDFLLTFLRVWETTSSARPDIIVVNSKFVWNRIVKYWRRVPDYVLTPPIDFFDAEIPRKRQNYIVAGAPFEFNKKGDFLLECIKDTDTKLKIIGTGSMYPSLKRKYEKYKNIEFLGNVTDDAKKRLLSNASCFVICGIEDFGIFPIEAMSCGTPVLAYKGGGVIENLNEGLNGYFFERWEKENFLNGLDRVLNNKWDYKKISESVRKNNNSKKQFQAKFKNIVNSITF